MKRSAFNRRDFLQYSSLGSVAAFMSAQASATASTKEVRMDECRYWMHGFGGDNPKATAQAMKAMGFDVVVAGGEKTIAAVREAGMQSWLCGGAFGLGKYTEDQHKAVDITGKPQIWFGSGSPNNPALREQNLKAYEKMAATEGIEGILVDGCRFASPASGIAPFFTDFSEHSEKKAAALGFDFAGMKKDVEALYRLVMDLGKGSPQKTLWLQRPIGLLEWLTAHPGILEWFRFRRLCSTEHFKDVSEIIHGAGLQMGVYIFTPSLAPLVGQSYVDLAEFVDVFAPMIYRNYPDRPGPACLNWELTIFAEELNLENTPQEAMALELILQLTGLAGVIPGRSIQSVRNELPSAAVGHETAMARAQLPADKALEPIIYIDDPKMAETAASVMQNGANGLNFFVYKASWADMVRPAFS